MAKFTVYNRNTYEEFEVYDITYDNAGYPHFLIFEDGQWIIRSAKHFVP